MAAHGLGRLKLLSIQRSLDDRIHLQILATRHLDHTLSLGAGVQFPPLLVHATKLLIVTLHFTADVRISWGVRGGSL
jgi:hypothetical protein